MTTRKHDDHLGSRFSKDFPQLKTEEKKEGGMTDLYLAVKSLSPVGDSRMNAGEGWTSAPAEIPNVTEKSGSYSVVTSNTIMGQTHNMAEALSQPPRTGTLPQGYSMIKRLEDRALKLIPIVPSAPKGSMIAAPSRPSLLLWLKLRAGMHLPDEEEAEFLKSLGWDEKNTEVEALTDEEIRAFYEQHKEVKPLLMKKLPIHY
ncbi:Uncharacterized protein Rs2_47646 [Raphanus sativus]|nr:Uncharacterized protein Rs2_47646 [Raphanus sativus]